MSEVSGDLPLDAPAGRGSAVYDDLKSRFFPTPLSGLATLAGLALAGWILWHALQWALFDAVFTGPPEACREAAGACWAVIHARWRLMFFGLYPHEEHWRSALACLLFLGVIGASCMPRLWQAGRLAVLWIAGFAGFLLLMRGGVLGLSYVPQEKWGGLTLSIFIFVATVLIGMPLAVALALLRRASLPLVARLAGLLIDGIRSLPLITILFALAVVLPILAPGALGSKLTRVILGMALFFAAYQAEIIRSGIQSLPAGQEEAAKALGLHYWRRMAKVILPQAFRRALPPTISQLAIIFMEVAMVMIVGIFDFLASGNAAYGSGEWNFANVEVYVFIALVYFVFVFSLSRYGAYLERRMRVGK
ncbi:amino acid ABC transporter permease [Poseidonocella sp. HB161398]|uniref:amino acid ABC transporter permease n=1 Tax=Poseidonocella sp. HB161398 TaxID=2320855 RepID=UPI0011092595|nr:amino acid ABC transporter permease [Poseidonocella sp. HB161398]